MLPLGQCPGDHRCASQETPDASGQSLEEAIALPIWAIMFVVSAVVVVSGLVLNRWKRSDGEVIAGASEERALERLAAQGNLQDIRGRQVDAAGDVNGAPNQLESLKTDHDAAEISALQDLCASITYTILQLEEVQACNVTLRDELDSKEDALFELQASHLATQEAFNLVRDEQMDTATKLESALNDIASLKLEHAALTDVHQKELQRRRNAESCLDKTRSDLSSLQTSYAAVTSELQAKIASYEALEVHLASESNALSELKTSYSETVSALKEAEDEQIGTAAKLQSALEKLQSLKSEHNTLVEFHQSQSLRKIEVEGCLDQTKSELLALRGSYDAAMVQLEEMQVFNSTLQDQVEKQREAFSELQTSQGKTLQALKDTQNMQVDAATKLRETLDELQTEHAACAELRANEISLSRALSEAGSQLSALREAHAAVTSELEEIKASNAELQDRLAEKLNVISRLQESHKETMTALQGAHGKQVNTERKLESSFNELMSLRTEHAVLSAAHEDVCRTREALAEANERLNRRVQKYENLNKDLEQENLQLRGDLRDIADQTHEVLSRLRDSSAESQLRLSSIETHQEFLSSQLEFVKREFTEMRSAFEDAAREAQRETTKLQTRNEELMREAQRSSKDVTELEISFEDSERKAERWRVKYENLSASVSPFQEQLELYRMETVLLERMDQATAWELSELNGKFSKILGRRNHERKTHYLSKLIHERKQCETENTRLHEQNLKQKEQIRSLMGEVTRLCLNSTREPQSNDAIEPGHSSF